MESARPLRDVFADLSGGTSATGDPEALLREQGHPGLPDHLVAEAVVSYADTAPAEVAEHLARYVTAHSAVGADEVSGDEPVAEWLDLLATAPAPADEPVGADLLVPEPDGLDDVADFGPDPGLGLDFGTGTEAAPDFGTGTEDPADAGPAGHGEAEAVDTGTEDPGDGLGELLADPGADLDDGDPADLDDGDPAGWANDDLPADRAVDQS